MGQAYIGLSSLIDLPDEVRALPQQSQATKHQPLTTDVQLPLEDATSSLQNASTRTAFWAYSGMKCLGATVVIR